MPSAVTVNTRGTVLLVDNSLGGLEVNIIVSSTYMHRTILRPMIEETEREVEGYRPEIGYRVTPSRPFLSI